MSLGPKKEGKAFDPLQRTGACTKWPTGLERETKGGLFFLKSSGKMEAEDVRPRRCGLWTLS